VNTTDDDLAQRVLTEVLGSARQVYSGEVDETLDPIAAGFDSFTATEMAVSLEDQLGVDCTLADIFDTTSLAELATLLADRVDQAGGR
jgi:acyl carrier protein